MMRITRKAEGAIGKAKGMDGLAAILLLACSLCLVPFDIALAAELLPDPTRPAIEAGPAGEPIKTQSGPVLQAVKISPQRRSAIISGQSLALGERFGALKLVGVSEGEVVLQGPDGRQTLKFFPGVEKSVAHPFEKKLRPHEKNKSKRKTEQKAP